MCVSACLELVSRSRWRESEGPIPSSAARTQMCRTGWCAIDPSATPLPTRAVPSKNGAYIRGLFLEGARWDPEEHSLNDSRPKQLYTSLPVLHLDPQQHPQKIDKGVYRCPVYKVGRRKQKIKENVPPHSLIDGYF